MALSIDQMMTDAGLRRLAIEQDIARLKYERDQGSISLYRQRITEMFGSLVSLLDMSVRASEYDTGIPHAAFGYESRIYHLTEGRYGWYLTRRDTRLSDDDRELPCIDFNAYLQDDLVNRQDAFLLALSELAERPEEPSNATAEPEPTPYAEYIRVFLSDVSNEVSRATAKYPPFNSAHEGYAVLLEEVDELWSEVKRKQSERDQDALITEVLHVAAMATRFAVEIAITNHDK